MKDSHSLRTTRNSKFIRAPREAVYEAFADSKALVVWLAPADMRAKVHSFDFSVGGGYRVSLYYPSPETSFLGKTSEREDRFTARFMELTPPSRFVQAITFDSDDPAFSGEMIMDVTFDTEIGGTTVTFLFKHIPSGFRLHDNEAVTESTLEKLANYVEGHFSGPFKI